jgi:hypothetical protein
MQQHAETVEAQLDADAKVKLSQAQGQIGVAANDVMNKLENGLENIKE